MSFYDEGSSVLSARLVSPDRKIKLQLNLRFSQTIADVLERSADHGLGGTMLLLDDDGTKICDDHLISVYLRRGHALMVATEFDDWQPRSARRKKTSNDNGIVDELKQQLSSLSDKLKKLEDDTKA